MSEKQQIDFAALSAPGREHARLKAFEGKFRAEVKTWMGPGEPMLSRGTMVNAMQLGGRFLQQEYQADPGQAPFPDFLGRGYWGFNKNSGKYEAFWIDTASTMMQMESGDVDDSGKRWTMSGQMTGPDGRTVVKRSVITLEDDDHHKMEMFFAEGGSEKRGMEIRYSRA